MTKLPSREELSKIRPTEISPLEIVAAQITLLAKTYRHLNYLFIWVHRDAYQENLMDSQLSYNINIYLRIGESEINELRKEYLVTEISVPTYSGYLWWKKKTGIKILGYSIYWGYASEK